MLIYFFVIVFVFVFWFFKVVLVMIFCNVVVIMVGKVMIKYLNVGVVFFNVFFFGGMGYVVLFGIISFGYIIGIGVI